MCCQLGKESEKQGGKDGSKTHGKVDLIRSLDWRLEIEARNNNGQPGRGCRHGVSGGMYLCFSPGQPIERATEQAEHVCRP